MSTTDPRSVSEGAPSSDEDAPLEDIRETALSLGDIASSLGHKEDRAVLRRAAKLLNKYRASLRAGQARQRPGVTPEAVKGALDAIVTAHASESGVTWKESGGYDWAYIGPMSCDMEQSIKFIVNAALDVLYGERNADAKGGM